MNLENRFFYRLVNAIYYFFLIIACLIAILVTIDVGFWWGTLSAGIFYSIINICKELLIYVAFGKKLTWEWLFNIRKILLTLNNSQSKKSELTLSDIAEIPSHILFINDGTLCYDWKPNSINISQELHDTAWYASLVYSFYIYFLLIRNKFGKEISSVAKQHLNNFLDGKGDAGKYLQAVIGIVDFISEHHESPEINLLVEDSPEEYKTACHFLITFPQSPYYLPDEKRRHITYGEMDEHCGVNAITTIMQCFSNAKKQSIAIFKPIIEKITLKPESINGLKIFEEIAWSSNPGCFEKHLFRKVANPDLFPNSKKISQSEADRARKQDDDDINEFNNQLKIFQGFFSSPNWADDVNELKDKLDKLIRRSREIGGKALDMGNSLKQFNEKIIETEQNESAENKNQYDEETRKKLEELHAMNEFVNNAMNDFYTPFIMQIHRIDSPIKDEEFAASVLAEDIETIRIFSRLSIRDNREISFKVTANKLVNNIKQKGISVPLLEEKINIINNIPGTLILDGLVWSNKPGCFERQLQRQSNNSLFPPKMRNIKQSDIENARKRDLDDINRFKGEVEKYENEVKELTNRTDTTFSDMLKLHKKISESNIPAYRIGGSALDCLPTLKELKAYVANILKNSAANSDNHDLIDSIDKIESSYDEYFFNNEFLQQICRDDSPITPTLVTSLLSENLESIDIICRQLSPDVVSQAKTEAIKVVKDMLARGEYHSLIKEKLVALGVEASFIK